MLAKPENKHGEYEEYNERGSFRLKHCALNFDMTHNKKVDLAVCIIRNCERFCTHHTSTNLKKRNIEQNVFLFYDSSREKPNAEPTAIYFVFYLTALNGATVPVINLIV